MSPNARKEIFISYSSQDVDIVEIICNLLEKDGLRCWFAPRDIRPGFNYPEEIIQAIKNAKIFVLFLTSNSNCSRHVLNEVENAEREEKETLSIHLEDIEPSDALGYFVNRRHFIRYRGPDPDGRVKYLSDPIKELILAKSELTSDERGILRTFTGRYTVRVPSGIARDYNKGTKYTLSLDEVRKKLTSLTKRGLLEMVTGKHGTPKWQLTENGRVALKQN